MADIESVIYSRATSHAGTAALIGSRCYPEILPQGATLPALTYHKVSDPVVARTMQGVINARYPRFQVDCWAATYAGMAALAAQVRSAFQDYAASSGGLVLRFTIVDDEVDLHEADNGLYRRAIDLRLRYQGG